LITTDNVLNLVPSHTETGVSFALGVLNSKITSWFYVNNSMIAQKDDFPQVYISALAALTIPTADKAQHDQMVSLVETMLNLHQQLAAAAIPQAKTMLRRQIEATDRQIDRLVYALYRLAEDEIRLVEGAV